MLFDTHLHLIYPERLRYPWLDNVHSLNKPSILESYRRKASQLGIEGCLHMEVDVSEEQIKAETNLISELMQGDKSKLIKGVISACRPESEAFPELVDWALSKSIVKGFRRVLHVVPDSVSQTTIFKENIRRLSGSNLTFDLCCRSEQLSLATNLISTCPDVLFVLDHCGVPDIKGGEFISWRKDITELAKRTNVIGKISGIIAYCDGENWSLEDLRPYFEHMVSVFGSERIIWGSDSPVCNLGGGLEKWVAVTHALTMDWDRNMKKAFFWDNAVNLWKLTE